MRHIRSVFSLVLDDGLWFLLPFSLVLGEVVIFGKDILGQVSMGSFGGEFSINIH
jgi:hypothetical protein